MSKQGKKIIAGLIIAVGVIGIGAYVAYSFYQSEQNIKQVANKIIEENEKSAYKKEEHKEDIKQEQPKQDEVKKVVEPVKENHPNKEVKKEVKNITPNKEVKKEEQKKIESSKQSNPSKEVKKVSPSKETNKTISKEQSLINEVNKSESDTTYSIGIPSIGLDKLPVRYGKGDEKEQLAKGGSIALGSHGPTEPGSNAPIGAYRNVEGHNFFRNIDSIKIGDELILYAYLDGPYKYKCTEKFEVTSDEYNKISENLGCTAITLYSFDTTGGERQVVRFKLG